MKLQKFNSAHKQLFNFYLFKQTSIKSGQRVYSKFINPLPIFFHTKFLRYGSNSNSGRSNTGRIVLWTRKSVQRKNVSFPINYQFRSGMVGFFVSISINSSSRRFISLVVLSSGSITYTLTNSKHSFFKLFKFYNPFTKLQDLLNKLNILSPYFFINQCFFSINQLPKNNHISMLELGPGLGIKYTRSPGSSSKMTKLDLRKGVALIILSSGVKKIFSAFSLGSPGKTPQNFNKYWDSNKAGYYKNLGRKSIVRGVARNPVDHPHGGRTKSIHYPRTPWGKTTKFK